RVQLVDFVAPIASFFEKFSLRALFERLARFAMPTRKHPQPSVRKTRLVIAMLHEHRAICAQQRDPGDPGVSGVNGMLTHPSTVPACGTRTPPPCTQSGRARRTDRRSRGRA